MKHLRLLVVLFAGVQFLAFNTASAITLSETPASVTPGGTAQVAWTQVANPTTKDWIGLYKVGTAETSFIDWVYTPTCTRTPGFAPVASGNCNFKISNAVANGTYEFRYFTNDSFTRLATSNQFTIAAARFIDNGDGTISDLVSGLMWEKKTGTPGLAIQCNTPTSCPDPHNVNNTYSWSSTGTKPDGALFTDFLTMINRADGADFSPTVTRLNYSDWRIPNYLELLTLLAPCSPEGAPNCIHPIFGPTTGTYWTSTTDRFDSNQARTWNVGTATFGSAAKQGSALLTIAVRGGR